MSKVNNKILICGAGPVGLALAIEMALIGIQVDIIEKKNGRDTFSKALSLNTSTLEHMEHLGIINTILDNAFINQKIYIHWQGNPLHRISLANVPSKYPYFAMIPQFKTEELLENRLNELGIKVQRGVELVSIQQHGNSVDAVLRENNLNRTNSKKYSYVIGCDGFNSSVRTLAGIEFTGFNFDASFTMFDAPIKWGELSKKMIYSVFDNRFIIHIPMANNISRIVIKTDNNISTKYNWQTSDYRNLLDKMGLSDLSFETPIWKSSAGIFNRLASKFSDKRVILAGDAAHAFSPIGGQGLNTGLLDVRELAWRLKECVECENKSGLLKEYDLIRRTSATRVRDFTNTLTKLILRTDRDPNGPLSYFLSSNKGNKFLKSELPLLLAGKQNQMSKVVISRSKVS